MFIDLVLVELNEPFFLGGGGGGGRGVDKSYMYLEAKLPISY